MPSAAAANRKTCRSSSGGRTSSHRPSLGADSADDPAPFSVPTVRLAGTRLVTVTASPSELSVGEVRRRLAGRRAPDGRPTDPVARFFFFFFFTVDVFVLWIRSKILKLLSKLIRILRITFCYKQLCGRCLVHMTPVVKVVIHCVFALS